MAWLKLIPWAKLPWKLIGIGLMSAALYFCWQEKQRAQGEARAWHQVITTVNAAVLQQEGERVKQNELAADSLKKSEAERKQLADAVTVTHERAAKNMRDLRTELSGDQRTKLDSAEVYYQAAINNQARIIGRLETEKGLMLRRAIRAEDALSASQRYNGQLQRALLAEQKQHKSTVGYVVGALGATVAVIALVAK